MESITIIPKNEKQYSVIKAFLKEMKIKFKTSSEVEEDNPRMSEEEFYAKIDLAVQQAVEGKGRLVKTKKDLHNYLDSL